MHKINPNKLLNSKWTAINPVNKAKHFIITEIDFDETGGVTHCLIESILSKHAELIDWETLKNDQKWLQGWK